MKKVVAFAPDLMDRSKLAASGNVTFAARPGELAELAAAHGADLVVVDLTRPGVLDALADVGVPVVGFSNHTNRGVMDAARAAGAQQVMARSAFFSRLGELLGR
jgi:hypothetical protein